MGMIWREFGCRRSLLTLQIDGLMGRSAMKYSQLAVF
ncbi:hypothetical protein ES319_A12G013500v1 [Gossypium barbadense]|uniref:Uncharacterized protein n=2 Tax=Gossypium TaxID=3633 RepID=A0A5J5T7R3_GOSBA|nr:hypothetical protein ES319_A12G013500v1 [Gossypium barbadense]TYG88347.1 hypothetical protein ES288_A12G014300v1 [Gossypium darwinii]